MTLVDFQGALYVLAFGLMVSAVILCSENLLRWFQRPTIVTTPCVNKQEERTDSISDNAALNDKEPAQAV